MPYMYDLEVLHLLKDSELVKNKMFSQVHYKGLIVEIA
jgi:hypothetical protein